MSTSNQIPSAPFAAQPITAEAVAAWLVAQTKALNLPGAEIVVFTSRHTPGIARFIVNADDIPQACADTLDEALAELRAKIKSPAEIAAEKRAAAQKLLDEAAAIETPSTPVDAGAKEVAS